MGTHLLGAKEIDGLLVHPGKAYTLLTDHLITGEPLWSELAQNVVQVIPSIRISIFGLVGWLYFKFHRGNVPT